MKKKQSSNTAIITFGEVILRLSPKGSLKMQQTGEMNFFFGGTELNVGASLALMGEDVKHISVVSNDFVGDAALSFIRKTGVNTSGIAKNNHPLGLYFLEAGAGLRPGQIAYNRLNGSFANINPDSVNWDDILKGVKHFHWTGITPGISENAYITLKNGLQLAREKGVAVSADPAYRSNLWKYGKDGYEVLKELVGLSTIFIGGVNEINEILQTDYKYTDEAFKAASTQLFKECPSIKKVFDKTRTGVSASWQKIYGRAFNGKAVLKTEEIEIPHVVDRIGTGDAFAAGIIFGLSHYDDQKTLSFANAACALKHTIYGDANLVTVKEILDVVEGNRGGRLKR